MGANVMGASSYPYPCKKRRWEGLEQRIFDYICEFSEANGGIPPTVRMIGKRFGISSTSHITLYLNKLHRKGKLARVEGTQIYRVVGAEWIAPPPAPPHEMERGEKKESEHR